MFKSTTSQDFKEELMEEKTTTVFGEMQPFMKPFNDFCHIATQDPMVFAHFKRDPRYTGILEHTLPTFHQQGNTYLEWIQKNIPELKIASYVDFIGDPVVSTYGKFTMSPTTLRYLKVLSELQWIGSSSNHIKFSVVEIGGGYGGQARVLKQYFGAKLENYWILDLDGPLALTQLYLEKANQTPIIGIPVNACKETDLKQHLERISHTPNLFCISNYAISECLPQVQQAYIEKILSYCEGAYITVNFGTDMPRLWQSIISKKHGMSRVWSTIEREYPLTGPDNYLWRYSLSPTFSLVLPHVSAAVYGGLGNQLFQIAAALFLGKQTNRPVLFEHQRQTDPHYGIIRSKYFDSLFSFLPTIPSEVYRSLPWTAIKEEHDSDIKQMMEGKEKDLSQTPFLQLQGYFQNQAMCLDVDTLTSLFEGIDLKNQSEMLQQEVQQSWTKLTNGYDPSEICSVHVRFYDPNDVFYILSSDYYQTAMKNIQEKTKDTISLFLIISEDAKRALELISLGPDGQEDKKTKKVFHTSTNELIDFYLLSKCRHHIIANSTFSWWSSNLALQQQQQQKSEKENITIGPSHWFKDPSWSSKYVKGLSRPDFSTC